MRSLVKAVYEQGQLRLLEAVDLKEGDQVTVCILSEAPSSPPEEVKAALDRICSRAEVRAGESSSGQDHDTVLYGEHERG